MINKNEKYLRVQKMKEYFTSKERVDVTDLNYACAIKLEKMINIYFGDSDLLSKYYQMKQLFKDSNKFEREYAFLDEYSNDSTIAYLKGYVDTIAKEMKKIENNIGKEAEKEILTFEKNKYFDDYIFAKYYVESYICYNESPYTNDFLLEYGLNENDFNRFVYIIFELDEELFNKYVQKVNVNKEIRKEITINKVNNLKNGITSDIRENDKYDILDIYRNLPFYDLESAKEVTNDFGLKMSPSIDRRLNKILEYLCSEDSKDIILYLYNNGVNPSSFRKITENSIMAINYNLNGVELTSDAKEQIIDYMKQEGLPFIDGCFKAVRHKYLSNELDLGNSLRR